MNDNVRVIAKRAGAIFTTRNIMTNPVKVIESVELCGDNIEKFAILIAKECMNLCANDSTSASAIARHFMVAGISPVPKKTTPHP